MFFISQIKICFAKSPIFAAYKVERIISPLPRTQQIISAFSFSRNEKKIHYALDMFHIREIIYLFSEVILSSSLQCSGRNRYLNIAKGSQDQQKRRQEIN